VLEKQPELMKLPLFEYMYFDTVEDPKTKELSTKLLFQDVAGL